MEMGSIVGFFENKTMLVTGATGFLAKIFVEKILREQPNVKKLYLLIRAADTNSAVNRFNREIIAKDIFRVLRMKHGANFDSFISQKVIPVAGDISCENLGVKDPDLLEAMWKQVDIVVNVAATTKFDERYDVALGLNTFGALRVSSFAMNCVNIKLLLHVSTAYVSGEKEGILTERAFELGETLNGKTGLDIEEEKTLMEKRLNELTLEKASSEAITSSMKELGLQRANHYGWPNTYVFTKAMGEMLIGQVKQDIPLVILRPTIITSTYKEPFSGWVEGIRTVDSLSVGYAKGRLTCFLGDPESILDMIPADMVVNAMIVAMVANARPSSSNIIYHVGSSVSNPLKYSDVRDYNLSYFTKHPFLDKSGKPIKVGEVTVLTSMASLRRYIAIRYSLPLKGLKCANIAFCQAFKDQYFDLSRKINIVSRFAELYGPYVFSKSLYDDTNLEHLRRMTSERVGVEAEKFYFSPNIIDWENYFTKIHLPGLVKYVVK